MNLDDEDMEVDDDDANVEEEDDDEVEDGEDLAPDDDPEKPDDMHIDVWRIFPNWKEEGCMEDDDLRKLEEIDLDTYNELMDDWARYAGRLTISKWMQEICVY